MSAILELAKVKGRSSGNSDVVESESGARRLSLHSSGSTAGAGKGAAVSTFEVLRRINERNGGSGNSAASQGSEEEVDHSHGVCGKRVYVLVKTDKNESKGMRCSLSGKTMLCMVLLLSKERLHHSLIYTPNLSKLRVPMPTPLDPNSTPSVKQIVPVPSPRDLVSPPMRVPQTF